MESKFKVGQVWKDRTGAELTVNEVRDHPDYPVIALTSEGTIVSFSLKGEYMIGQPCVSDLVELVSDPAITKLTPGEQFDVTRTEFIERAVHDLFFKAISEGWTIGTAQDWTRAAVKLRDELVRGDAS
jgi:hypothetical protein